MIKLCFIDRETMEDELVWLKKGGLFWEMTSAVSSKEHIRVNPVTLEVELAHGWERYIGALLQEGKIRIVNMGE